MEKIRSVCVYCGSGPGSDPAFVEAAHAFGALLAKENITLVYGGGSLGLMGAISKSVIEHGGTVVGVIPGFLTDREKVLTDSHEVIVTRDMHERKRIMFERADAFVAMPGGIGTLEELVEQMTWAQLGRHRKPILLLNIKGFWDPFNALLEHMSEKAFIRPGLTVRVLTATKPEDILPKLRAFAPESKKVEEVKAAKIVEQM
jgi:uncharacterized protein (TIGR00730 family)